MRFSSFTHIYITFLIERTYSKTQDYQGVVKIIVLSAANDKETTN